jgi:hypothetical protein
MAEKATKGPWGYSNGEYECGDHCHPIACPGHDNGVPECLEPVGKVHDTYNHPSSDMSDDEMEQWIIDWDFIAASREAVPELINHIRLLELALTKATSLFDNNNGLDDFCCKYNGLDANTMDEITESINGYCANHCSDGLMACMLHWAEIELGKQAEKVRSENG